MYTTEHPIVTLGPTWHVAYAKPDQSDLDALLDKLSQAEVTKVLAKLQAMVTSQRGRLSLRDDICRAYWDGVDLGLTLGEFNIVQRLKPGEYVSYRAIYDVMHHEGFIAGPGPKGFWANVRSAIKRVRNKFRAIDPSFDAIQNYTGYGYCWRVLPGGES